MKNNALFLFLTLIFLPSFAFSIGIYAAGDRLTIHATSGLILRETAAPTGKKILTINYGALVAVQAEGLKKTAHAVTVFKGFTIKGFWVKIKTADGKTGFVFDGYLSKYKTPGNLTVEENCGQGTIQECYMELHTTRKGPKVQFNDAHYKITYLNGAEVDINRAEGGAQYIIRFNQGMTIEEAYLIGKALWMNHAENIQTSVDKGVISLLSGDETTAIEVYVKAGIVNLSMNLID